MATLNLRIAKTKNCGESKKSPLHSLSEDLLKAVEECSSIDQSDLSNSLKTAPSLDAQVVTLQRRIEEELKIRTLDQTSESLQYQILLFLNLPAKSPLKARFLKMLKVWSEDDDNCLPEHLQKIMSSILLVGKLDSSVCMKNIVTLLEYFESNTDLLTKSYPSFTEYIKQLVVIAAEKMGNSQVSSLRKLCLYECIHDSVRALLLIIHADAENKNDSIITKELCDENFLGILKVFVHHNELPMDTKLNCGLLFMRIIFKAEGASACVQVFYENCLTHKQSNSFAKACYCAPLFNIFSIPELSNLSISAPTCSDNNSVFQCVCSFLFNMSETFAAENDTILALNRAIEQLAEHLSKFSEFVSEELAQLFLNYIWMHIDHYMDNVRHRTKKIFEHFISFSGSSEVDIVNRTISSLASAKMTSKFFCIGIQLVSKHVETDLLLKKFPGFIETYVKTFEEIPASTHLVAAFNEVMCSHLNFVDLQEWMSLWINPVLEALNRNQTPALEQVLNKAILHSPQIIESSILSDDKIPLYSTFICLHIGIKNGLVPDHAENQLLKNDNESWKGIIPYEVLYSAVCHQKEDLRLLVFVLLTESKKTTQAFSTQELTLVSSFLKYNLNNQNSAFRQKFLSNLKKFLVRYRDSFACLRKLRIKDVSSKELIEAYDRFRENLILVCSDNLFPSANFGRRCTVLNLLRISFDFNIFPNNVFPSSLTEGLLFCLNDTYEENKALAKHILHYILRQNARSKNLGGLQESFKEHLETFDLLNICKKLVSSTHPSDCVTAAYFLGFFIDKLQSENLTANGSQNIVEEPSDGLLEDRRIYLCEMVNMLKNQVEVAEKNILEAAVNGPVYGAIYVIRYLLSSVDLQAVNASSTWRSHVSEVIQLCFRASSAVSHIVNNMSPEGHLPMDFTVIGSTEGREKVKTGATHATSQLLLLCAWRTIKEISLIFGELIERTPIVKEETQGFLTDSLLLEIGSYFMRSLSQIKHRGAFEQAYIGFSKVCLTLWKCPIKELSELPRTWLKEMMTEIAEASDRLCATRRSAGVPYIIQALLVSEHQISPSSNCFHSAMNQLLSLCESTEAPSNSKIHALNILRNLFRSTELGDQVNTYVARAVKIAVLGFIASSWPERNSSTLLLSALLVRIFGVPRSKHTLTWKNKMTGRIFFMRYPSLYEFFLSQLEAFASNINNLSVTNTNELTIFPILLILGRLYPSSLEGTDSNLQLSNYVKYVHHASRSRIHDIRVLASTAISSLITRNNLKTCIENLFNDFKNAKSDNERHGVLLQLSQIILNQQEIPAEIQLCVQNQTDKLFAKWLDTEYLTLPALDSQSICSVVKDSLCKLLLYSISKCNYQMDRHATISMCLEYRTWDKLGSGGSFDCNLGAEVGKSNFNVTAVLFLAYHFTVSDEIPADLSGLSPENLVAFLLFQNELKLSRYITALLQSSNFDVVDTILTFLFYTLLLVNKINVKFSLPKNECEDLNAFIAINHDFKFFQFVLNSLKQSPGSLESIMEEVLNAAVLHEILVRCLKHSDVEDRHHLCVHKYLAVLRFFPAALDYYLKEGSSSVFGFKQLAKFCFKDNDDSVTVQALHCISSYLIYQKQENKMCTGKDFQALSDIIFSGGRIPDLSDQIRYAISLIIAENYQLLCEHISPVSRLNLMTAIIDLSQDDLAPIRESTARILGTVNESTRNLELLLEEYKNNKNISNSVFAVFLSAWMLKDIDYTAKTENQEKVFDKTDMNAYFEEVLLTKLAASHLKEIFSSSEIMNSDLSGAVVKWLSNYCDLDLKFAGTLSEIFSYILSKLSFVPDSYLQILIQCNLKDNSAAKQIKCLTKLKYIESMFVKS